MGKRRPRGFVRRQPSKPFQAFNLILTVDCFICAHRLTKNAPSKSKLPKKHLSDLADFHQSATELYQEVEVRWFVISHAPFSYSNVVTSQQNILREFEQHPPHPGYDEALEPHHSITRSRSSSLPPLPKKAPSPKVTFDAEIPPDTPVAPANLTRKESTRRGVELRDEGRHPNAVDLARQDSAKPSSSSRNREPKEEDITRSTSHVSNLHH